MSVASDILFNPCQPITYLKHDTCDFKVKINLHCHWPRTLTEGFLTCNSADKKNTQLPKLISVFAKNQTINNKQVVL
jgi:hypothetical protein